MSVAATAPRRTGPKVLAVLLAAVFLGVIGASAGYVIGVRVNQARAGSSGANPPPDGTHTAATTGHPTPTGVPCPRPTIDLAHAKGAPAGPLYRVLYVETDQSEVWICRDSAGRLWYQGHRKSAPDLRYPAEDLVDGRTSLLLSQVNVTVANRRDEYLAVNVDPRNGNQTRYAVTTETLVISGSVSSTEPVIRHEP